MLAIKKRFLGKLLKKRRIQFGGGAKVGLSNYGLILPKNGVEGFGQTGFGAWV